MTDLLDALHYMFEDDLAPSTGEQQEARMKNRERIYTQMYGRPSYEWAVESADPEGSSASTSYGQDRDASGRALPSLPDAPTELKHKEYIPPTPVDARKAKPFGDILDAPLG